MALTPCSGNYHSWNIDTRFKKDANADKSSVLNERIVSRLMILPVTGGSTMTYFIIYQVLHISSVWDFSLD